MEYLDRRIQGDSKGCSLIAFDINHRYKLMDSNIGTEKGLLYEGIRKTFKPYPGPAITGLQLTRSPVKSLFFKIEHAH